MFNIKKAQKKHPKIILHSEKRRVSTGFAHICTKNRCTSIFLGICSNCDTPSRVIVQISSDISKLSTGLCKSHPTSRIYRQDLCKNGWQKSVFDVQIEFQVFFLPTFKTNFGDLRALPGVLQHLAVSRSV